MKHTEIPSAIDDKRLDHELEHGDKTIYANIRRYMNKSTRECFPSQQRIAKKLKCSRNRVAAAIDRLIACGFLIRRNDGKKNHYIFPESEFDKKFEMFTDAFLDMDLDLNVKEFYMDIQQFLFGKETGVGRCSMSNSELSRATGWAVPTIKKYKTILIQNDLLTEEETGNTDCAGLPVILQSYNLAGLNQAVLWVKAVTEQISANTEDIKDIQNELLKKDSEIEELKKRILKLESLERNASKSTTF